MFWFQESLRAPHWGIRTIFGSGILQGSVGASQPPICHKYSYTALPFSQLALWPRQSSFSEILFVPKTWKMERCPCHHCQLTTDISCCLKNNQFLQSMLSVSIRARLGLSMYQDRGQTYNAATSSIHIQQQTIWRHKYSLFLVLKWNSWSSFLQIQFWATHCRS